VVKLWKHSSSTKVTRIRIRPQHHEWVDKLGSSHRSVRFFLPILRFSLSSKTKTWLDLILFVVNTCTHLTRRHIGSDCYASLLTDEITSWTIYVDKYTTNFPSNNNNEHSLLSVPEEIRNAETTAALDRTGNSCNLLRVSLSLTKYPRLTWQSTNLWGNLRITERK